MLEMRSFRNQIEVEPAKRRGFTLVELLIVVAIIGLLVAMLLPALTKARRAANQAACMSNMRQIVMAVLTYTMDNRGRLMPALIYPVGKNQPYPDGFFWAAELVHQNYLQAPNLPHSPTIPNNALAPQPDAGVFDCPDAIRPGEWDADANGNDNGSYPTDPRNNGWCYMIDDNPRNDGQPAYGTATYYELNCRLNGYPSNYNEGTFNSPFMYFAKDTDALGQTELQAIANQQYSRVISMVQHADTLVLLGEAANINWTNQNKITVNGVNHFAPRLGARHGSYSADRTNAWTNLGFFDGHVASVPTQPIDRNDGSLISNAVAGMSAMTQGSGTVFTLALDHN